MEVQLVEVRPQDTTVRAALMRHTLPPEQRAFSATGAESLPLGDGDRGRTSVAVLAGGRPVGMFCLDRGGYLDDVAADPHAVLLRAFYIAPEHQGRGHARAAVHAMGDFVRRTLPGVRRVVLTVNHRNPAAIATYRAGGFRDTGQDYLGGGAGPQHVLELEV